MKTRLAGLVVCIALLGVSPAAADSCVFLGSADTCSTFQVDGAFGGTYFLTGNYGGLPIGVPLTGSVVVDTTIGVPISGQFQTTVPVGGYAPVITAGYDNINFTLNGGGGNLQQACNTPASGLIGCVKAGTWTMDAVGNGSLTGLKYSLSVVIDPLPALSLQPNNCGIVIGLCNDNKYLIGLTYMDVTQGWITVDDPTLVLYDLSGTGVPETSQTPLPAALPLFATGLGALGLLGWRRKRNAQTAA